jgi:hypothetical protein
MRKPTMNRTVHKAVKQATRVEQVVLRTPLAVLDEQVLSRVPGGSRLRGLVGRGIQALDSAAGRSVGSTAGRTGAQPEERAVQIPAEEVEERAAHLLEEQEQHPLAGELAEDDELRRVQAELKAKHAVEAEQESRPS